MRLVYANKMGAVPEEIGGVLRTWGEEVPELIEYRKYNPHAPIFAFITYPDEKIDNLTSVRDFLVDVIPLYEQMKVKYMENNYERQN